MARSAASYTERLTVPWWAWPASLAIAALLAAQLTIGAPGLRHPLTYAIAGIVVVAGLLALSRVRIAVDPAAPAGPELQVDDARLPIAVVAAVTPLSPDQRRDLLGVDADPLAFVIQRPWVPGGVRVDLDDPADPTPYWFISSRHPEQLAAAIGQARGATVDGVTSG